MKSENIIHALNGIDPELIADAEKARKKSISSILLKWGAAAACFCVLLAIVLLAISSTPSPDIPIYHSAIYTASDIASFFEGTLDNAATSAYTQVYVPSPDYLYHQTVPDSGRLTIYQSTSPGKTLDQSELADLLDPRIARLAEELGATVPSYTIDEMSSLYRGDYLQVYIRDFGKLRVTASQNAAYNNITFYANLSANPTKEICLGGARIQVDQTQSDAQIADSLSDVKEKLFSVFGVRFSDIKILRHYDAYSEHGVTSLSVYFYNEADHPMNAIMDVPVSEFISLNFDNFENWSGDVVSDTVLCDVSVTYHQLRANVNEIYAPSKQVDRISLEDAEALLYKGYVFGGHACPICMSQQSKVDFSDYDFVGIVYISESATPDGFGEVIPFYAFYKKIGTAKNGNAVYAQTYVPAIEVSGYEEYFNSQQAEHNTEFVFVEEAS